MSAFRTSVAGEVALAQIAGQTYDEILADLATNIGWMIAAGSQDRKFRLGRVRACMQVIADVLDSPPQSLGDR